MPPASLACLSSPARVLVAAFALCGAVMAHAAPASFTSGKAALLCGDGGEQKATWSGACKDGLAEGAGIATWTDGDTPNRLDGTLVRGTVNDVATLVYGTSTYIGTFVKFDSHGQGFFKYADGSMYEGGVADGEYSGPGIFVNADRSRYEGEWVKGRREGQGRATFALGGSYDGHWRGNRFDGKGTIVYIGGRTWTGEFKDGRVANAPPLAPVEERRYRITNTTSPVGTYIPALTASSAVSGARWADLTENERRIVRARYAALEEGDEPPYPIDGMRPVFAALSKTGYIDRSVSGLVRMQVLVGVDGKPKSAATIGKLAPEVARFMAGTLMVIGYKPAICHGTPCEMLMPVALQFGSSP
jgi:hypothetical protein